MKYKFIIKAEDFALYESDELFDSYDEAEEMAQEWCSEFSAGAMEADPGSDVSLEYEIEEVDED